MVFSQIVKENEKKEKEKGISCEVILTAYGNAMALYFFLKDTP